MLGTRIPFPIGPDGSPHTGVVESIVSTSPYAALVGSSGLSAIGTATGLPDRRFGPDALEVRPHPGRRWNNSEQAVPGYCVVASQRGGFRRAQPRFVDMKAYRQQCAKCFGL